MNIKEAITSISEKDSLIGEIAKDSLATSTGLVAFAHFIADQFNAGCGASMAAEHGHEVINTIIKYSDNVKMFELQNKQGLEAILSNPIIQN